ncbi:hypothetical protein J3A83DRAFT_4187092 [Scleroderma citrinum]
MHHIHYFNPLHPPVPESIQSQHSALSDACPILSPPFPTHLPPTFMRLPQVPPPKLLSVPCRTFPAAPVTFDLIGAPMRGLGVPMRELVVRSGGALERMLVGASEHVGAMIGKALGVMNVRLVISWPGYEHVDWSLSIELFTFSGPLTRGQLALQIASAFQSFIITSSTILPAPHVGNWRIASTTAAGSTSTGTVSFDRLVLFAFWNVCDDVWMAEAFVDRR